MDGLILRSLQKRMKNIERRHWLQTAIQRTLPSAIFCILFFGIVGGALHFAAPKARSVGEVWTVITTPKIEK